MTTTNYIVSFVGQLTPEIEDSVRAIPDWHVRSSSGPAAVMSVRGGNLVPPTMHRVYLSASSGEDALAAVRDALRPHLVGLHAFTVEPM